MVKVPEYTPDVQLRPNFRAGIEVRATPEAFGSDIGRGLQSVAAGLDNFGDAVAQVKALEDEAAAKEADNAFAGWTRERMYGEGGFLTLEGSAAVNARRQFDDDLEAKRKEFGAKLKAGAAQLYHRASTARASALLEQAVKHTGRARKEWFNDASTARATTFANDAVAGFGDPALVEKNIAFGQAEIRQQAVLQGWGEDTLAQREAEYISGVRLNVALRAMAEDPVAAKRYYDRHKDQLTGPDQFRFEQAVKIPLRSENVKRHADDFFQTTGAATEANAAAMVRQFEGFRTKPYWDVNAYRVGFGSDTITRPDGSVVRVEPGMEITRADAERDLKRRINTEFVPGIVDMVGRDAWTRLPSAAQAALASVAYNYGSLPFAVASAVVNGDLDRIARAVDGLKGHNSGINADRRAQEAAIIRSMTGMPIASAAAIPSFGSVEQHLAGIADPEERDLARKAIYAQLEARTKAEKAQREANQAEAFRLIETQELSPFDLPPEIATAIGMEGMSSLMDYWQKRSAGQKPVTDERLLYDMRTLYATNPDEFAKVNLFDYKNSLSPTDYRTVEGWRQTALTDQRKAKADGLSLTAAFSQAGDQLAAVGLSVADKKGAEREEAAKRVAAFQNVLASELETFKRENKDRAPTQPEIQSIINRLLLPIVVKGQAERSVWDPNKTPWSSSYTSSRDGLLFEARSRADQETVDVNVAYEDIPIDLRMGIARDIETEIGRQANRSEVVQRYEDFVLGRDPTPIAFDPPARSYDDLWINEVLRPFAGVPSMALIGLGKGGEWVEKKAFGIDRGDSGEVKK